MYDVQIMQKRRSQYERVQMWKILAIETNGEEISKKEQNTGKNTNQRTFEIFGLMEAFVNQ